MIYSSRNFRHFTLCLMLRLELSGTIPGVKFGAVPEYYMFPRRKLERCIELWTTGARWEMVFFISFLFLLDSLFS